jgi:S1-C subfamily serine protease
MDVLSLSCEVNPGNSGGPICNVQGEVVGMVTLISTQTGAAEGGAIRPEVLNEFVETCRVRSPDFHPLAASDAQGAKDDWPAVVKRVSPSVVQVFSLRPKASRRTDRD